MPVRVIGMIGVTPPAHSSTLLVIEGAISPSFIVDFAKVHEAAGFDMALVGYTTSSAEGFLVAMHAAARSYDTAVATAPGGTGEGFYSMTPTLYAYPDDPRPAVRDLMARYRAKYGIDMNYIGQTGVSVAQIALEALQRAGRDLTVDSLVTAMESLHEFTDIYGNTYSFGPKQHHGSTKAFL